MKRLIIFALFIAALWLVPAVNGASQWPINSRPNADWFSDINNYRNVPLMWMREVDPLIGGQVGTATIRYVNSNVSNAGDGSNWANAVATLNAAINLADPNDVIYIAQGHTEATGAAADEVDIDVAGLYIEQLGDNTISNGFDYTGDVTGAFAIGADNITLVNLRFHANVPDVNEAIDVEAGSVGMRLIRCLFDAETLGTDEFLECVTMSGANSNLAKIVGNEFNMGGGAARCAISFLDSDFAQIVGNKFTGDYYIADINNVTTASISITITDNELTNGTTGGNAGLNAQPVIELVATTSGFIDRNLIACNLATPELSIVAADCWLGASNVYTETEGGVSVPPMWLGTDTALNIIGFDDADNQYASTNVVANADGTVIERLEQLSVPALPAATNPNYFVVTADMASATWNTATAHEIAAVTGAVRLRVMAECTVASIVTVGTNGTIALGHAGNTASIWAAALLDTWDITEVAMGVTAGVPTFPVGGGEGQSALTHCIFDLVSVAGIDVGYTIGVNAGTTGTILFHVWWTPLDSTGAVTAGAGGPF